MIIRPTVLVLGAGASTDYAYPTGKQLMDQIVTELSNSDSGMYKFLLEEKYSMSDIGNFSDGLINAGVWSIDELLENKRSYREIGKLAITYLLALKEAGSRLRPEKDWYALLLQALVPGQSFEGIAENKLSILTFNYDRSLEHNLFESIKRRYDGISTIDVAKVIKAIPIIHLHGQVGFLPWQHNISVRSYGDYKDNKALVESSKQIKIIHEIDIDGDPNFEEAFQKLQSAEFVYFLGFGYHAENLRKLKIDNIDVKNKRVWGTSYNLTEKQLQEAMTKAGNKIDLKVGGAREYDVYKFLYENVTF